MKYFIIAGEASGDLHAAALIAALKKEDREAQFSILGGDLMTKEANCTPIVHYRDMAYMGLWAVICHLDKVIDNLRLCKEQIKVFQPDVVVLVDYPSFNLKIARFVKQQLPQTSVHYYISPKIWAWKEYRIKQIKRDVDRMFSILPFEVDFYKRHHYAIDYVGNPTVDEIATRPDANETFRQFTQRHQLSEKPIIALLAGSRISEVKSTLPIMLQAAQQFPDHQIVIAAAPSIEPSLYHTLIGSAEVAIIYNQTYNIVQQAKAALVTSGTATLETAILGTPQVVCYMMSGGRLVYKIMEKILQIKYVSLVNLIADQHVVPELLLHQFTAENTAAHLSPLLSPTPTRKAMLEGYKKVAQRLGAVGAPQHTAEKMVKYLKERTLNNIN